MLDERTFEGQPELADTATSTHSSAATVSVGGVGSAQQFAARPIPGGLDAEIATVEKEIARAKRWIEAETDPDRLHELRFATGRAEQHLRDLEAEAIRRRYLAALATGRRAGPPAMEALARALRGAAPVTARRAERPRERTASTSLGSSTPSSGSRDGPDPPRRAADGRRDGDGEHEHVALGEARA
jgi:hypothetical protein